MPRKNPRPAAQRRRAKLKEKMQGMKAAKTRIATRKVGILGGLGIAALIANSLGYHLVPKTSAPDKETVAEELADDVQGLGRWADVCTDPTASKAEVEREAAALVDEIIETKELKLREKS